MRFVVNAQIRRQIMERLKAERPEPESELNHNNAFELLIAVMLSAQATDKSVNLATPALFAAMPDAATMAQKKNARRRRAIHQNDRPIPKQGQTRRGYCQGADGALQR